MNREKLVFAMFLSLFFLISINIFWFSDSFMLLLFMFSTIIILLVWVFADGLASPPMVLSYGYFLAFLFPVPFYFWFADDRWYLLEDFELAKSLIIALIAFLGAVFGGWLPIKILGKRVLGNISFSIKGWEGKRSSVILFVMALLFLAPKTLFNMGQAGSDRFIINIPYVTGLLVYFFQYIPSVCLIFLWIDFLRKKSMFSFILFGSCAGAFAISSIILGWKGAFFSTGLILIFTFLSVSYFWSQRYLLMLAIGLCLLALGSITTDLALMYRSLNSGSSGNVVYANQYESSIAKKIFRLDGNGRCATVISYVTPNSLSLFSSDSIKKEIDRFDGVGDYIDTVIFRIPVWAFTSVGGSGPGTRYLLGGVFGVFVSYFIYGVVLNLLYFFMSSSQGIYGYIAVYSLMGSYLFVWGEGFSFAVILKQLVIILISVYLIDAILVRTDRKIDAIKC